MGPACTKILIEPRILPGWKISLLLINLRKNLMINFYPFFIVEERDFTEVRIGNLKLIEVIYLTDGASCETGTLPEVLQYYRDLMNCYLSSLMSHYNFASSQQCCFPLFGFSSFIFHFISIKGSKYI